jgi:hypothetical protein
MRAPWTLSLLPLRIAERKGRKKEERKQKLLDIVPSLRPCPRGFLSTRRVDRSCFSSSKTGCRSGAFEVDLLKLRKKRQYARLA